MSSVNYEELAKNARAAAKIQEKTEQNTRSWYRKSGGWDFACPESGT